jgi:hypothetical protein
MDRWRHVNDVLQGLDAEATLRQVHEDPDGVEDFGVDETFAVGVRTGGERASRTPGNGAPVHAPEVVDDDSDALQPFGSDLAPAFARLLDAESHVPIGQEQSTPTAVRCGPTPPHDLHAEDVAVERSQAVLIIGPRHDLLNSRTDHGNSSRRSPGKAALLWDSILCVRPGSS